MGSETPRLRWLPLALAVLVWHTVLAELVAAGRAAPVLRWPALLIAFALPAAGVVILVRGPDLATRAGRRLRLWAHLATVAPAIATGMRLPRGLPARAVWLVLFAVPLVVALVRDLRGGVAAPAASPAVPPPFVLKLHRWCSAIIVAFAALHFSSHAAAAFSLALNTRVVDLVRLVYKQPPIEALLLLALPVQIVTGVWLFAAMRDRAREGWDRLQLAAGLYIAVFLALHATATAILFRDLSFRGATGGSSGMVGDPGFLAYYVLGPLAVFAHVACGARALLLRRLGPLRAARIGGGVLALGTAVTLVISLALCGVHVRDDRHLKQPRPARVGWR